MFKITIEIPDHVTEQIIDAYFNKFGGEMSYDQLMEFLKSDIVQVYMSEIDNAGDDGINDALDMFIAD